MLDRIIFELLQTARDQLLEDEGVLRRHFCRTKFLDDAEIERFIEYFNANPPDIIHQYPRGEEVKYPLWAIILISERESTSFLGGEGDYLGSSSTIDDDDPDEGANEFVAMFNFGYGVLTVAEHPDVARWYHELAKFILMRGRNFLLEAASEVFFSGQDLAPDPRYIPAHLFVRQLGIEGQRVERAVGEHPTQITRVEGIHVHEDGQGGPTGVKALVTVSAEGDGDGDEEG